MAWDEHIATTTRRTNWASTDPYRVLCATLRRGAVSHVQSPDRVARRHSTTVQPISRETQHVVVLTGAWADTPQHVSTNYTREITVMSRSAHPCRARSRGTPTRATARRAGGNCGENSRSEGARGVRDLIVALLANALRPQGAVLPAKNQDASHHPLVPSQLRPTQLSTLGTSACASLGEQPCELTVDCRWIVGGRSVLGSATGSSPARRRPIAPVGLMGPSTT
jgi:hypothetical protein